MHPGPCLQYRAAAQFTWYHPPGTMHTLPCCCTSMLSIQYHPPGTIHPVSHEAICMVPSTRYHAHSTMHPLYSIQYHPPSTIHPVSHEAIRMVPSTWHHAHSTLHTVPFTQYRAPCATWRGGPPPYLTLHTVPFTHATHLVPRGVGPHPLPYLAVIVGFLCQDGDEGSPPPVYQAQ